MYDARMTSLVEKGILRQLTDGHLGIQWLQGLARAGVKSSGEGPGAVAYVLAQRANELDEQIAETFQGEQVFFRLPPGWWLWVPMLYTGGFMWALERRPSADNPSDFVEERWYAFMAFCVVLGVVSASVLVSKYLRERRILRERAQRRPRLRGERAAVMLDLMAARDELVADSPEPAVDGPV